MDIFTDRKEKKYFNVFVNGQVFNCFYSMSIQDFLLYLNYNLSFIVVESNQEIIQPDQWSNLYLKQGDKLEIITIVGGG